MGPARIILASTLYSGDDVDEATARDQSLKFAAFEGAGFKPALCLGHPHACDLLNATAVKCGATVLRNLSDVMVEPGNPPEVKFWHDGRTQRLKPALVWSSARTAAIRWYADRLGYPSIVIRLTT